MRAVPGADETTQVSVVAHWPPQGSVTQTPVDEHDDPTGQLRVAEQHKQTPAEQSSPVGQGVVEEHWVIGATQAPATQVEGEVHVKEAQGSVVQ